MYAVAPLTAPLQAVRISQPETPATQAPRPDVERIAFSWQRTEDVERVTLSQLRHAELTLDSRLWSFKIPVSGRESYGVGSRRVDVSSGSFLITPPEQTVRANVRSSGKPVAGVCLYVNAERLAALHDADPDCLARALQQAAITPLPARDLHCLARRLHQTYAKANGAPPESAVSPLLAEALGAVETLLDAAGALGLRREAAGRHLATQVMRGRDFLEAGFAGKVSITEAAAAAGLSLYHFIRAFHKAYGESPYQYVLRRRLETACLLLGTAPVSEIALRLGFGDVAAFSKAFKARYGAPPSRYAAA